MSVSPNEVFTMEKIIKNAKGKVLTLGCGMGYFAYMVSLKEDVESITIVESEQSVIDLFEKSLIRLLLCRYMDWYRGYHTQFRCERDWLTSSENKN